LDKLFINTIKKASYILAFFSLLVFMPLCQQRFVGNYSNKKTTAIAVVFNEI